MKGEKQGPEHDPVSVLMALIEEKREAYHEIARVNGVWSPEALTASAEIDRLEEELEGVAPEQKVELSHEETMAKLAADTDSLLKVRGRK